MELIEETEEIDFLKECKKNDISVFWGDFIPTKCDIALYGGPAEIIKYCSANNIKSIFLEAVYKDVPEVPDIDMLKQKIKNFFEKRLNEFPYSMLPEMITQEFYNPTLDEIIAILEEEYDDIWENRLAESKIGNTEKTENTENTDDSIDEDDDVIETIEAWVINGGSRIHTTIYDVADFEDDENIKMENMPTEKEFLHKYFNIVTEKLIQREKEARNESLRLVKESHEKVLEEITAIIKANTKLASLHTQKSRNDFADRLCVEFQEKGVDWLTKTVVRKTVEREYFHLTE